MLADKWGCTLHEKPYLNWSGAVSFSDRKTVIRGQTGLWEFSSRVFHWDFPWNLLIPWDFCDTSFKVRGILVHHEGNHKIQYAVGFCCQGPLKHKS